VGDGLAFEGTGSDAAGAFVLCGGRVDQSGGVSASKLYPTYVAQPEEVASKSTAEGARVFDGRVTLAGKLKGANLGLAIISGRWKLPEPHGHFQGYWSMWRLTGAADAPLAGFHDAPRVARSSRSTSLTAALGLSAAGSDGSQSEPPAPVTRMAST
jgi:hypothetical protein